MENRWKRIAGAVTAVGTALWLSACGGFAHAPGAPGSGLLPSGAAGSLPMAGAPHVAGTYRGSYSETSGSETVKGTVTMVVDQKDSGISGKFDITVHSVSFDTTFKGTVSKTPHGARLRFTIFNNGGKGRNAKAKAFVIGKKLDGKAYVAPNASKKAVYIKFKTKRV
jgi:hypothetical protein